MTQVVPQCRTSRSRVRGAFTLIEMLIVMTVMGLLLAMSGMAFQGSIQSQTLSAAARQLSGDLEFAALLARKENRPVDVLFYQFEAADSPGGATKAIRAYQFAVLDGFSTSGTPVYRFLVEPKRFPSSVVLSTSTTYTSLMGLAAKPALTGQVGGVPETYTYFTYQIRPDGTTTLDTTAKHPLTLVHDKDLENNATLPADFRTVLINPANARTRVY